MSWPSEKPVDFYDADTTERLKLAFAAALQRHPSNAFDAAREIEPSGHPGRAMWIVENWYDTPEIQAVVIERDAKLGVKSRLPDKDEFAATVYREAGEIRDNKTRLEYYRTVGEVLGFIKEGKSSAVAAVNVAMPNRIRLVSD